MRKHTLHTICYPQEGDFQHTYSPLKNLMLSDGSIGFFRVKNFGIDLGHPVNLECQPSYDGTVNLIINDDKNPPRIINSRFSKIEDNRFRVITRNQKEQTNLYKWDKWDTQTRLFRTSNTFPIFHFIDINYFGQLKGGNYTFYIKFADDDYNQTDVLCESGQISIFKGNTEDVKTICGTLSDERTDKSIRLKISNIDTSFSKMYFYYSREYSDLNGFRMTETKALTNPYDITGSSQEIIINGFEAEEDIDASELNIKFHYTNAVKTQTQVQNMLFFGNVETNNVNISELQNISYFFNVRLCQKQESIGYVKQNDFVSTREPEYYSPYNIYYNLGYWPGEIYRLGVVYIMNDDSLSPVFNLRGVRFEHMNENNMIEISGIPTKYWNTSKQEINRIERNKMLSNKYLLNSYGVFRNPYETSSTSIINDLGRNEKEGTVKPWFYRIQLEDQQAGPDPNYKLSDKLKDLGVKGYFFVRQKRIPITLCQGISCGIDISSHIPCVKEKKGYSTESFLRLENSKTVLTEKFSTLNVNSEKISHSALLSVDAMLNPNLQSTIDGSLFSLLKTKEGVTDESDSSEISWSDSKNNRRKFITYQKLGQNKNVTKQCLFINEDVPYKYVNGYEFSTRVGNAESVKDFGYFGLTQSEIRSEEKADKPSWQLIRGIYAPIIGVCGNLESNCLYTLRIPNYSELYTKEYFQIRANDNSPFYTISDRFECDSEQHDIYRGDCYTNTVTLRLNRNFTDPDAPIQDTIVDINTWNDNYKGKRKMEEVPFDQEDEDGSVGNWTRINRSDVNAVQLGTWYTYKCLSNYNLGLRSEDSTYPDEEALIGNKRTFYPYRDLNIKSSGKIPESKVLNNGYSSTVGIRPNIVAPDVPYTKDIFDTRVMFSNINVEGDFKNGYRVFQGLSYKDVDRQYGAIVKLLDWGTNLLCIFEHGIAILPVNEKALIQTTTEQSIHMYGAGVLQNQVSLISPDFGSIWPESIIRTPIGVYGVDTYAKKIWRYTTEKGLETISDMKVQRFLNDHILLKEADKYPIIALKNVKSHYNNYKGDVMFTFYNKDTDEEWNLCYNERMDKWITRYSWTPLFSENINNIFYSMDKKRAEVLSHIYYNKNCTRGIWTSDNLWAGESQKDGSTKLSDVFTTELHLVGVDLVSSVEMQIKSIKTSLLDENNKEVEIEIPAYNYNPSSVDYRIKFEQSKTKMFYTLSWNYGNMKRILETENQKREYNGLSRLKIGEVGVPMYYKIEIQALPTLIIGNEKIQHNSYINGTIGIVIDPETCVDKDLVQDATLYDNLLQNGFYVHGRAGIFDEIDYTDNDPDNQIKPTHWYNKQEPFEFEFVVNEDVGLHKIFENLVIISNRVKPESLEFEITGDVYSMFKGPNGIYDRSLKGTENQFKNAISKYDTIQNRHTIVVHQDCKDIEQFKRRLGNIHYKEDSWYITIDPLIVKDAPVTKRSTARIRDKYLRVRVKYSGEDLAIITAIKNIYNLTHS